MEKIPTVEELIAIKTGQSLPLKRNLYLLTTGDVIDLAKEVSKLYVEAALKAAAENAVLLGIGVHRQELRDSCEFVFVEDPNGPDYTYSVDKESILTAYPPENIK